MSKKFSKVKVAYVDYPSIAEIDAFILFGAITSIVKPKERMFSYWDMDSKEIEIDEISKEDIENLLEDSSTFTEGEGGVVNLTFDETTTLSISTYDNPITYEWK